MNCRILKDKVLPSDNVLSNSCTKAKKMLKMLGVEYMSYHECVNDCILAKDVILGVKAPYLYGLTL
jgi:hypothetical protein